MKNKNKITIIKPMNDSDKLLVIKTFNEHFDYTSYHSEDKHNVFVKPVIRPMPINLFLDGSFEDVIDAMLTELVKRDIVTTKTVIEQKEAYVGPGCWT